MTGGQTVPGQTTRPVVEITGVRTDRHDGAVVVIDVIRAFTTAASAFAAGAAEIICVEDLDHARALRRTMPDALLMGEERGDRPEGFDFGNSPRQFDSVHLTGRTLIQRTSNGTRGLLAADAPLLLAASAVNATATATLAATAGSVRLVCTSELTSEDRACANHLRDLIHDRPADSNSLSDRIRAATDEHRAKWNRPRTPHQHQDHDADIHACAQVDRHTFAMIGHRQDNTVRLTRHHAPSADNERT